MAHEGQVENTLESPLRDILGTAVRETLVPSWVYWRSVDTSVAQCGMAVNEAVKKTSSKSMSAAHKAALAKGREEGRAVRLYLDALEETKPRRGRRRTPQSITRRLKAIEAQLQDASSLQRLQLAQERIDLEAELAATEEPLDLKKLETSFVKVAKGYGERKGITYGAWRAVGVSAAALKKAGINRGN